MKRLSTILAGLAFAVSSIAAVPVLAEQWHMPTRSNMKNFFTVNISQFADEVKTATGGKVEIVIHPEDSLFKQPDVKRAVQTGQVAIGEYLMALHTNENPLFGIDTIPFLTPTTEDNLKLLEASWPHLEATLQKQGIKLLYASPWPANSLYSAKPLQSMADLKGIKFRVQNPMVGRLAELMGVVPVTVQQAEVSQAFSTGVIEAMITSSTTGVDTQAWDFVKYFYSIEALRTWNVVVVNSKTFDRLDQASRDGIVAAAKRAQVRGWQMSAASDNEMLQVLKSKGMNVLKPSDALMSDFKRLGEIQVKEWADSAGPDGKAALEQYRKIK